MPDGIYRPMLICLKTQDLKLGNVQCVEDFQSHLVELHNEPNDGHFENIFEHLGQFSMVKVCIEHQWIQYRKMKNRCKLCKLTPIQIVSLFFTALLVLINNFSSIYII